MPVENDVLARLRALKEEHRSLDARIQELSSRTYLTPEDQLEIARLKKLKLKKKDEILMVASQAGIEI